MRKIPMLKSVPLAPKVSVGVRRLAEGLYRVLLEDLTQRQASYFEVGTLRDGALTVGANPRGQAAVKMPEFPAAIQELSDFTTVDTVMSE
jgi:hypothetical protein